MTALKTRLISQAQLNWYLCAVLMTSLIFVFIPESLRAERDQQEFGHLSLDERWRGDFDGMVQRRLVRVLVVFDKIGFFIDKGQYRGVSVELLEAFKSYINRGNTSKALQVEVLFLPVYRNQLIPALVEGKGDIAVGNLTIIEDRLKKVDFSKPFLTDVKQIVITNSQVPSLSSIDDLSGQNVHIRRSSSYYKHVAGLNKTFSKRGLRPVNIIEVDEHFEDSDLLQMVNEGLIAMTVVDDHIANLWSGIFKNLKLYHDLAINEGGDIGWAFRKNSPRLAEVVNNFLQTSKKGTTVGNVIFNRYLLENKWVRSVVSPDTAGRYHSVVELFKKYADQYDFDYLMTKALAYQESQLDHNKLSPCGAVGIMQLLPKTAADKNVGIPDIENLEDNVHAGHKYLRFIQDRYFNVSEIDNLNRNLLTFAAYNAGPKRIIDLRNETKRRGLNPNVWFKNVELIAAEKIGRETVQYVSNIYKYYIAYKLSKEKADKVHKTYITMAEIPPNLSNLTGQKKVR